MSSIMSSFRSSLSSNDASGSGAGPAGGRSAARRGLALLGLLLVALLCASSASAQQSQRGSDSRFSARLGLGFTADPSTFLTSFEFPFAVNDEFQVGPLIQVGVSGDETIVAPTVNLRFLPNFGQRDADSEFVRELRPFLMGGIGLAHLDVDTRFGDVDDTEFLFNLGFGVDYPISDRVLVGTQMLFNIVPGGVLGDKFFFSWQLANFTYRF